MTFAYDEEGLLFQIIFTTIFFILTKFKKLVSILYSNYNYKFLIFII
jgi:hypothetical protein